MTWPVLSNKRKVTTPDVSRMLEQFILYCLIMYPKLKTMKEREREVGGNIVLMFKLIICFDVAGKTTLCTSHNLGCN